MEEGRINLNLEEVIKLSSIFDIEPLFNGVIITLNTEEQDGTLVLSDNVMSEVQYVIAKGDHVRSIEVADKVILNLEKMMTKEINPENQYEYITRVKVDPIEFNGGTFGLIEDRMIKAKYKNQ